MLGRRCSLEHQGLDRHAEVPCGGLGRVPFQRSGRSRNEQDGHTTDPRDRFLEKQQAFGRELIQVSESRHVAAWVSEARYQSRFDWVGARRHHDGNRRGRSASRLHGHVAASRDDNVDLRADELLGEILEQLSVTASRAIFDVDRTSFYGAARSPSLRVPRNRRRLSMACR